MIPKKHYVNTFDTPESELIEIMKAIKNITNMYKKKLGIDNVQIVNSSGEEAQQDVFHTHYHIVPRHRGDGQDIRWEPRIEIRDEFSDLLDALK